MDGSHWYRMPSLLHKWYTSVSNGCWHCLVDESSGGISGGISGGNAQYFKYVGKGYTRLYAKVTICTPLPCNIYFLYMDLARIIGLLNGEKYRWIPIHHAILSGRCLISPKLILQKSNDPKPTINALKKSKKSSKRWYGPQGDLNSMLLSLPGIAMTPTCRQSHKVQS